MSSIVKLKSATDEIMETSVKCARMSHTIKDLMENLGLDSSFDENTVIPVSNVSTNSLKKIIEYMEHYQDTPQPTAEEIKDKLAETIPDWDTEFLKMPLQDLYDLISASNYLNIPGLLWLTTREVAYMIKGKSPEEIRQLFNIENDWTQSELEMVQKENQWCEEK